MTGTERFNILIIDPDGKSRAMLKDAALSLPSFKKVHFSNSLDDAMKYGDGVDPIDVVTVSYRFNGDDVAKFVSNIKKTPRGREWAFVNVMKSKHQENETVAESMLNGMDGFLFEPYSADNLREMAEVTAKVRLKNEIAKKRGALELFLNEVTKHIDAISFYASQKRDPTIAKNKLTNSCNKLKRFKTEDWNMYTEVLVDVFSKVLPPATAQYQGVSKRVRERLKSKMMKELEDEYNET
jgi:response regulator RpfG family c-di-GMP phosphodiesterase